MPGEESGDGFENFLGRIIGGGDQFASARDFVCSNGRCDILAIQRRGGGFLECGGGGELD